MNHKTSLLSLLLLGCFCMSAAIAGPNNLGHIRALVDAATAEASKLGCRNAGMMLDNLMFLQDKAEFRALQDELVNSWKIAVLNLDAVADADMGKAIVLCSCWKLSEEDFVEFLSSTASLVEEGKLDRQLFLWCQSPFASDLSGFLVQNYQDPAVQDIILRSRSIFQDQPERVAYYDSMLTGESRRKLEQFEAAMREERPSGGVFDESRDQSTRNPILQNTAQTEPTEEPKGDRTPSVIQPIEEPVRVASSEEAQPEEQRRWFVLPIAVGITAVLSCVGIWMFRRHVPGTVP